MPGENKSDFLVLPTIWPLSCLLGFFSNQIIIGKAKKKPERSEEKELKIEIVSSAPKDNSQTLINGS